MSPPEFPKHGKEMMQLLNGDLLRSIRVLVVDDFRGWRNQVRLLLQERNRPWHPCESERGKMFLRMEQLPGVDNPRNYPAEITKGLEELLLSGGSALPDAKRKGFYDLEDHQRTFFVQISSITGRVALLATWLRPNAQLRLWVEPGPASAAKPDTIPFRATFR
jgi:hypothetical protein